MTSPEPSERRLIAQIAAHSSWAATTDRAARTQPARAALAAKFLEAADGDPVRAEHFRRAYYARLALKSAASRRRAKQFTVAAEAAEAELAVIEEPTAPASTTDVVAESGSDSGAAA
jgi:hypothetical protein